MRHLPLLACLILFSACGPEVVYKDAVTFPETGWSYADSTTFSYSLDNVDQAYDLVLDVNHGIDFPYQNFYVKLHSTFPNGKQQTEQLSHQLAGDFGVWLGDCSGDACTLSIPFLQNIRYTLPGEYRLTVEQNSRDEPLAEALGIGLRVVVSEAHP
ncbi:MAG: gliding motility lipoprotein GldH [Bacteroidota bacterium]